MQDPIKKRLFLDGFTAMDSVALGGHRWGGGSTGVCYLDLHSTQTFSLCVSDGASQQLGGCLRDFRNKPFPVRVRVEYYQQALTVSCQFYLCGVLQAGPHRKFSQSDDHLHRVLLATPTVNSVSQPVILRLSCFKKKEKSFQSYIKQLHRRFRW